MPEPLGAVFKDGGFLFQKFDHAGVGVVQRADDAQAVVDLIVVQLAAFLDTLYAVRDILQARPASSASSPMASLISSVMNFTVP